MTRISKKGEIRGVSKRRPHPPMPKTGAKKDNIPNGFKAHENALSGDVAATAFIPKIK